MVTPTTWIPGDQLSTVRAAIDTHVACLNHLNAFRAVPSCADLVNALPGGAVHGEVYGALSGGAGSLIGLDGHVVGLETDNTTVIDFGFFPQVVRESDGLTYHNLDDAGLWRGVLGTFYAGYHNTNGTANDGTTVRAGRGDRTSTYAGAIPQSGEGVEIRVTTLSYNFSTEIAGNYELTAMMRSDGGTGPNVTFSHTLPAFTQPGGNQRYSNMLYGSLAAPIFGGAIQIPTVLHGASLPIGWRNEVTSVASLRNQAHTMEAYGSYCVIP